MGMGEIHWREEGNLNFILIENRVFIVTSVTSTVEAVTFRRQRHRQLWRRKHRDNKNNDNENQQPRQQHKLGIALLLMMVTV